MDQIDIAPDWQHAAAVAPRGVLLVVGAGDTGKSTFARFLHERLAAEGRQAAYLDGDAGQTSLGPPGTMTVTLTKSGNRRYWRWFVGSTTPRGHMLPVVIGTARLAEAARSAGADTIICDTSGLVDASQGGLTLKLAKIDLLRPAALFALQRTGELERLLIPLRLSGRVPVIDLQPSAAVHVRSPADRQAHRAGQFATYFADAGALALDWHRLGVFPTPRFLVHQLVALEDGLGLTEALGIVLEIGEQPGRVVLQTPLRSPAGIQALRLGDMLVNPETYRDQALAAAIRQGRAGPADG